MEKMNKFFTVSLFTIALLLCFASSADSRIVSTELYPDENEGKNTWCIAKPSTDTASLYQNIEYSCRQYGVDCRPIQPGGLCFFPNNVVSRASVAMNLYYKSVGKNTWNCDFRGTGLIVSQDPSVGYCIYPV